MKNEDRIVLERIIGYCDDIESLLKEYGNDFGLYKEKIAFQYSCNMCIIQIGELVSRLSEECMEEYDTIPWYAIKGMRNLHAHDYENVDLEIVWNTLMEDIPNLRKQILDKM